MKKKMISKIKGKSSINNDMFLLNLLFCFTTNPIILFFFRTFLFASVLLEIKWNFVHIILYYWIFCLTEVKFCKNGIIDKNTKATKIFFYRYVTLRKRAFYKILNLKVKIKRKKTVFNDF